jgi:hypothetical protein
VLSRYYLGSQAVSRELQFYDSNPAYHLPVYYLNASQPSVFEKTMPSSTVLAKMNAQFFPSVLFEISQDAQFATGWDSSGNMLVPTRSPSFVKYHGAKVNKHGWWKTNLPTYQTWSSVLGIPLKAYYSVSNTIGINADGTRSLDFCYGCVRITDKVIGHATISTNYIQPNCSFAQLQNNSSFPGLLPYVNTVLNITDATIPTIQISQLWNNNSTIVSICNLTETRVELDMLCTVQGCRSQKEKATLGQPLSSSIFGNQTAANMFLNSLLMSGGVPSTNNTDDVALIDSFDGTSFGFFDYWKEKYTGTPIGHTNSELAEQTSLTLTKLLNAYLFVSQLAMINMTVEHTVDVLRNVTSDPNLVVATMKGAPYIPQYRLNWIWMSLDFVGCVVLLLAASAAVWLEKHTLAPDIFGYVSSLTRDNPMIQLPEGGSTLNGIDRARMLKGVKVMIADIGGSDGMGKVGLAMKDGNEENVAQLKKSKQYL